MEDNNQSLAERFEVAITEKLASDTRIIELEAHITAQGDVIDGLKKEVEQSLLFVAKAEEERMKMFAMFLMQLTQAEKDAIKKSLINEFGLKE
jgi:uncharacterized coiled-coil protein SlyX